MIKNPETAKVVSELMLELGAKLNESVAVVRDTCEEDEFQKYRSVVAKLMTTMLLDVMNPVYSSHPELKPEGLR